MSKITVVTFRPSDPRLKRFVEHDDRSRNFAISAAPPPKPVDIFWPTAAPILDQGNLGACVGFTGADYLNTQYCDQVRNLYYRGKFLTNTDGKKLYHLATLSDRIAGTYPPTDTGSSGLGLAKALRTLKLISSYEHAFNWAHVEAGIAVQPLSIGTLWTNTMMRPDPQGVIHVGSLDDSNVAGGHQWMLRGMSYTRGLALGRNHWNPTWDTPHLYEKLPGEFWIPIPDLKRLLANEGDVTRMIL